MTTSFDEIVIGVGAMGAATCFHLARRGRRVLGLERFGIPHVMGSSHGGSRMTRTCYCEHPDYVPLLRRAAELWGELEECSGRTLRHLVGGLYMGSEDDALITGSLLAARTHGLPHEQLSHAQLADRFSSFRLPPGYVGVHEPNAGLLLPEQCIVAHAEGAMRHGAEIHGQEPVLEWHVDSPGVEVRTERGTYRAEHLIFCSGAWTGSLLGDLSVEFQVTRQVLGWVWPRHPDQFALGTLPVWAIGTGGGTLYYGFPMLPDRPGLKLAFHCPGAPTEPDAVERTTSAEDEQDFRPLLASMLPDADGPLLSMEVCLYTSTLDGHCIIDQHPEYEQVLIAAGFSGHGFKFASVVGEVLADLAERGSTDQPVEFLKIARLMQ